MGILTIGDTGWDPYLADSVSANDVVKMRLLGAFLFIHTQKLTQKIPVAFVACGFYFCFGK